MIIILNLLFTSLAVFIVAKILPGIHIKNFGTAVIVAFIYSVINFLLGKILFFFAFPVIFITFFISAVGESLGYLFGAGQSVEDFNKWELMQQRTKDE